MSLASQAHPFYYFPPGHGHRFAPGPKWNCGACGLVMIGVNAG